MKEIKLIAIDLAKHIFQIHGCDERGQEVLSRQIKSRGKLREFMMKLKPCVVGMEASGGSHHWGRLFKEMGHEVRMVAPQFVKPFVRGEKNDRNDARAIAEAIRRPEMRFVSVKSLAQQDVQSLHRIRSRLVKTRTMLSNEARGILGEYGVAIGVGHKRLKEELLRISGNEDSGFSDLMRRELIEIHRELRELDRRILEIEKYFVESCKANDVCKRLMTIPGVGPMTSTAIWAHVGSGSLFKNGRQFAAYFGLVPRQNSSGGKARLGSITKRGDRYIRQLLIHGARSVIRFNAWKKDPRSLWIDRIDRERGRNKACVALANKNARIIWVLMTRNESYKEEIGNRKAA